MAIIIGYIAVLCCFLISFLLLLLTVLQFIVVVMVKEMNNQKLEALRAKVEIPRVEIRQVLIVNGLMFLLFTGAGLFLLCHCLR